MIFWTPRLARAIGFLAALGGLLQLVVAGVFIRGAMGRPAGFWASPDLAGVIGICLLLAIILFSCAARGLFHPFPRSAQASPLPLAYAWFIFFGWLTVVAPLSPIAGKALAGICAVLAFAGCVAVYFLVRRSLPRGPG